MQISGTGLITNTAATLRAGLDAAAQTGPAQSLSTSGNDGDPLYTGITGLPPGFGGFDRTVTTTVDDISIKIGVARVANTGNPADAGTAADEDSGGETVNLEIKTVFDPASGTTTKTIEDPAQATSSGISAAKIQAIESQLAAGKGVFEGNVVVDDQRTITDTVYKTVLEADATGKLQPVRTISSSSSTRHYNDNVTSTAAFDATNPTIASASSVASSLLGTYASQDWLEANIPGLTVSAQA